MIKIHCTKEQKEKLKVFLCEIFDYCPEKLISCDECLEKNIEWEIEDGENE